MEGFTIVDGVVALVIVLSALLAYSRGLVREALAIAGWIVAAMLAVMFAPQVQPLVKEVPVIGEFLSDSCELSIIAAFAAVFALVLVVTSLFTPVFSGLVQRSALGGLDQGLGFLYGAIRGMLLVVIALIVYDFVVGGDTRLVELREALALAETAHEADPDDADAGMALAHAYTDLADAGDGGRRRGRRGQPGARRGDARGGPARLLHRHRSG